MAGGEPLPLHELCWNSLALRGVAPEALSELLGACPEALAHFVAMREGGFAARGFAEGEAEEGGGDVVCASALHMLCMSPAVGRQGLGSLLRARRVGGASRCLKKKRGGWFVSSLEQRRKMQTKY